MSSPDVELRKNFFSVSATVVASCLNAGESLSLRSAVKFVDNLMSACLRKQKKDVVVIKVKNSQFSNKNKSHLIGSSFKKH